MIPLQSRYVHIGNTLVNHYTSSYQMEYHITYIIYSYIIGILITDNHDQKRAIEISEWIEHI
jgi:hypothetical protein